MLLTAIALAVFKAPLDVRDFGAVGDGKTMCTRSIQQAIDAASKSKGTVHFPPGRYLTGTLHLKSNITLKLDKGATILGSTNRDDYVHTFWYAVLAGKDVHNVTITGEGRIDGQGVALAKDIVQKVKDGKIKVPPTAWRPPEQERPEIIEIDHGSNILVKGITIANSACWVQQYRNVVGLSLLKVRVDSKSYWNNDGIDVVDCHKVEIKDCDIDSADDGICLKSDDPKDACEDVVVERCRVRSSASAVKFGTSSHGGFKRIVVRNIEVRNTFRSAVALEAVDGADLSYVECSHIHAVNTGNAFVIRLGHRWGPKAGQIDHVVLRDFDVQIPAGQPDAGYPYQGPHTEDPQNLAPASIVGLPEAKIKDVVLENIRIRVAGGISPKVQKRTLDDLSKVPERPGDYPEFSMFGELPAWALYARHVEGLTIRGFTARLDGPDYRPPFVLDDVKGVKIGLIRPSGPVILHNVSKYRGARSVRLRTFDH